MSIGEEVELNYDDPDPNEEDDIDSTAIEREVAELEREEREGQARNGDTSERSSRKHGRDEDDEGNGDQDEEDEDDRFADERRHGKRFRSERFQEESDSATSTNGQSPLNTSTGGNTEVVGRGWTGGRGRPPFERRGPYRGRGGRFLPQPTSSYPTPSPTPQDVYINPRFALLPTPGRGSFPRHPLVQAAAVATSLSGVPVRANFPVQGRGGGYHIGRPPRGGHPYSPPPSFPTPPSHPYTRPSIPYPNLRPPYPKQPRPQTPLPYPPNYPHPHQQQQPHQRPLPQPYPFTSSTSSTSFQQMPGLRRPPFPQKQNRNNTFLTNTPSVTTLPQPFHNQPQLAVKPQPQPQPRPQPQPPTIASNTPTLPIVAGIPKGSPPTGKQLPAFTNWKDESKSPGSILSITNLSKTTTSDSLSKLLSPAGTIRSMEINSEKGTATVAFQNADEARFAKRSFHRNVLDDNCIIVSFAKDD